MEHKHLHPGNNIAITTTLKDHAGQVTYQCHIHNQDTDVACQLTKSEYYNLGYDRYSTADNTPSHVIIYMMDALADAVGIHSHMPEPYGRT